MKDIILDTLVDSIKMLPFLFLSYLIIEFIEHKSSKKIENAHKAHDQINNKNHIGTQMKPR